MKKATAGLGGPSKGTRGNRGGKHRVEAAEDAKGVRRRLTASGFLGP